MADPIVIASTNQHKVDEIRQMLGGAGRVESIAAYGVLPTVDETGTTFLDNAVLKAVAFANWLAQRGERAFVLADDSGICIDALGGRPGVYSARFAGPNASDADNNAHMVAELEACGHVESPAQYVCVLSLVHTSGERPRVHPPTSEGTHADAIAWRESALCVTGRCAGVVRTQARGERGFGYDPHFWIDDHTRTFAELSREAKAMRSHRGDALRRLRAIWSVG